MKIPLLVIVLFFSFQALTTSQEVYAKKHGIGIDLLPLVVGSAGKTIDDLGFDILYKRFYKKGELRFRLNVNQDNFFEDGHLLQSTRFASSCVEEQRQINRYEQKINYKINIGYVAYRKINAATFYYGIEAGFGINRSNTLTAIEGCYVDDLGAERHYEWEKANQANRIRQFELTPLIGVYLPLSDRVVIAPEFGAILRMNKGHIRYIDEFDRTWLIDADQFELAKGFLSDIALIFKF